MNHACVIVYDGIRNSVFQSQVIVPLVTQLNQNRYDSVTVVSYERDAFCPNELDALISDPRISLIVCTKIPFVGTLSLRYAAHQLQPLLAHLKPTTIIARGPLAGWVVAHANHAHIATIVQARGLCAQEYLYTHSPPSLWHRFRAASYERIEKWVYGLFAKRNHVTIHAVSAALKEYLVKTWYTPSCKVEVTTHDVPDAIHPEKRNVWRKEIRKSLSINSQAHVFAYCGSAHAWQCPDQTVRFFAHEHEKNPRALLLLLTHSPEPFLKLLMQYAIPRENYRILSIAHDRMYHYLSAADAGLLFRKKHCINWVSRPTKALEYQAVGLPIIHNNTVGMLCSKRH